MHPGITLREKLNEMEMSVKEFALRTTKPEKTINAVLSGESAITPDMSIAFEQITQIPAHFWRNLQRNYDEYVARQKREAICRDAATIAWAKKFPYGEMAKLHWVPSTRNLAEKIVNLFTFFKVNSVAAWEDYYINQKLKSAFRISLSSTKDPYSMSAWLRQGEILAEKMKLETAFSENTLKDCIPQFKQLVMEQPDDFSTQLTKICASVGIKVIYMNHITHEGHDEKNRVPDFRRMERIDFPRFMIDHVKHPTLKVWLKRINNSNRIHILNKEERFIVVLDVMEEIFLLWTAFYIEQNHTLRKKLSEYEEYIKTQGPHLTAP